MIDNLERYIVELDLPEDIRDSLRSSIRFHSEEIDSMIYGDRQSRMDVFDKVVEILNNCYASVEGEDGMRIAKRYRRQVEINLMRHLGLMPIDFQQGRAREKII